MKISRVRDFLCAVTGTVVLSFGIGCGGSDDSGSSGGDTGPRGEDAAATSSECLDGQRQSDPVGASSNFLMMLVAFDEDFPAILDDIRQGEECGPTFHPRP